MLVLDYAYNLLPADHQLQQHGIAIRACPAASASSWPSLSLWPWPFCSIPGAKLRPRRDRMRRSPPYTGPGSVILCSPFSGGWRPAPPCSVPIRWPFFGAVRSRQPCAPPAAAQIAGGRAAAPCPLIGQPCLLAALAVGVGDRRPRISSRAVALLHVGEGQGRGPPPPGGPGRG